MISWIYLRFRSNRSIVAPELAGSRRMLCLIVGQLDAYANSVKPKEISTQLAQLHYDVKIYNTLGLGRLSITGIGRFLPSLSRHSILLYPLEMSRAIAQIANRFLNLSILTYLNGRLLRAIMVRRGKFLNATARTQGPDIVICESGIDECLFLGDRIAPLQVLDLPAPFLDEQLYAGTLSESQFARLRKLEIDAFDNADRLSFHWHTYQDYVRSTYYSGTNWFKCDYGVRPKPIRAQYDSSLRIIFLGMLDGYWVNLPLLEKLCRMYPAIDLWGGPMPHGYLKRHYRGYAESVDIMAEYQLGLVTITDDPLRQHSFSSKHLEYISYGLPVLTPAWRQDRALQHSSES